jgi:hypothetical protein
MGASVMESRPLPCACSWAYSMSQQPTYWLTLRPSKIGALGKPFPSMRAFCLDSWIPMTLKITFQLLCTAGSLCMLLCYLWIPFSIHQDAWPTAPPTQRLQPVAGSSSRAFALALNTVLVHFLHFCFLFPHLCTNKRLEWSWGCLSAQTFCNSQIWSMITANMEALAERLYLSCCCPKT